MENYRLGLDIGTNSVGWCVLGLDGDGKPCRVEAAGSRIFTQGRDSKTLATLAATRRAARTARRRRDRYLQRRRHLIKRLAEVGLFPEGAKERLSLQREDPLELRAQAIREKISPHQIGRALFHINQRRGFKSNRKDQSKETKSGKVSNSVYHLLDSMQLIKATDGEKSLGEVMLALEKLRESKNLTFGAFLWEKRRKQGLPIRARTSADGKLYDVYPTREILEDEFWKICKFQQQHHPTLLTDEVIKKLGYIIFHQRDLRQQEVGHCTYIKSEKRTFRDMPSFQIYRIYQEVHNLEWSDESGRTKRVVDYPQARDGIVDLLRKASGQVKFEKMKDVLRRMEIAEGEFKFNFETEKRKGFDGDKTSYRLAKKVGKGWWQWSLEKQDNLVKLLLDEKSDDIVVGEMQREYGLSRETAKACLDIRLTGDTANLSLKAARLIADKMKERDVIQYDAVVEVAKEQQGFVNPMEKIRGNKLLSHLPYYGEVFQDGRHIIPGDKEEKDRHDERRYFGGVTNPTVHIALNQIRKVVNELIERFGQPASMAIELGRDLPLGPKKRREIEKQQKDGQVRNDKLNQELRELGFTENVSNRLRLRLWKELMDERCPFSGEKITPSNLFTSEVEIEHLIPFSQSLDDSYANKVLCLRSANRHKGQRTPFEAFGDGQSEYDWEEIYMRSRNLPLSKQWRFQQDARKRWERSDDGFSERHLNDTRYIARLTREYMQVICPIDKIDVVTGRLTALLRKHWGLNSVLSEDGSDRKNRDDHRHHAIDAIVIGMTTRSMIQKVATAAGRSEEELEIDKLFPDKKAIDPWDSFREDVKNCVQGIIVSHQSKRNKQGKLHNETAYGFADRLGEDGWDSEKAYKVVHRKPIEAFKENDIQRIQSPYLREIFLATCAAALEGSNKLKAFQSKARELRIRRLRVVEKLKVIPITDRLNKPYKYYKGDNNWGMEIYAYPEQNLKRGNPGNWEDQIVSLFDANKKDFKPGHTLKPHPAARLVMTLFVNDCLSVTEGGRQKILRVQRLSHGSIILAEHNEANADHRDRDKSDKFQFIRKSAEPLRKLSARKVHISPTGRIRYEG